MFSFVQNTESSVMLKHDILISSILLVSLLTACDAVDLLRTASGSFKDVIENTETGAKVATSLLSQAAAGKDPTEYFSWRFAFHIHRGCYKWCWLHMFSKKSRAKCRSEKAELCKTLKIYSYKAFITFHLSAVGLGSPVQMPGKIVTGVGSAGVMAVGTTVGMVTEAGQFGVNTVTGMGQMGVEKVTDVGKISMDAGKGAVDLVGGKAKALSDGVIGSLKPPNLPTPSFGSVTGVGKISMDDGKGAVDLVGGKAEALSDGVMGSFKPPDFPTPPFGSVPSFKPPNFPTPPFGFVTGVGKKSMDAAKGAVDLVGGKVEALPDGVMGSFKPPTFPTPPFGSVPGFKPPNFRTPSFNFGM